MHMLQLNPSIPMMTPRGPGFAILCLDYSQEHDLIWCVALTESGEMWCLRNQDVRIDKNYTLGPNGPRPLEGIGHPPSRQPQCDPGEGEREQHPEHGPEPDVRPGPVTIGA
jgi:hypothetical protein